MSVYPSIEKFNEYLLKKTDDSSFLSLDFKGYRNKAKDLFRDKKLVIKYYDSIKSKITNLKFVPEDSHILMFYDLDNTTYISKLRFDESKLINSIVEEIYNEKNSLCVLTIEYDGTNYYGMQRQGKDNGEDTIQEELEKALKIMLKKEVLVYPASRTDKGVHAKGQVVHFDSFGIDPSQYKYALNNILPKDIRIKEAYLRSQLFNSRYDAIEKTYNYIINMEDENAFEANYMCFYKIKNISKMRKELKTILGTHDFLSFSKGYKEDTVRTIYDASLHLNKNKVIISITGDGFLHNMIRFIVGSLIEIDRKGFGSIKYLLDSKDKNLTPTLAPSAGLYLMKIKY